MSGKLGCSQRQGARRIALGIIVWRTIGRKWGIMVGGPSEVTIMVHSEGQPASRATASSVRAHSGKRVASNGRSQACTPSSPREHSTHMPTLCPNHIHPIRLCSSSTPCGQRDVTDGQTRQCGQPLDLVATTIDRYRRKSDDCSSLVLGD